MLQHVTMDSNFQTALLNTKLDAISDTKLDAKLSSNLDTQLNIMLNSQLTAGSDCHLPLAETSPRTPGGSLLEAASKCILLPSHESWVELYADCLVAVSSFARLSSVHNCGPFDFKIRTVVNKVLSNSRSEVSAAASSNSTALMSSHLECIAEL